MSKYIDRTTISVTRQLDAMGCNDFEVGIYTRTMKLPARPYF